MKSLSNLNTFSNTQVTVIDNRDTNIVIGQVNETTISTEDSLLVFPAINAYEIYSISNGDAINVRLQLSLSSSEATVQWSNDPRFTIVQTGTTYTVTGINSDADWNLIKNPIITLPAQFPGVFTYSFSITYNTATQTNLVLSWNVSKVLVFSSFQSTFNLAVSANQTYNFAAALTVPVTVSASIQPITLSTPASSTLYSSLTQNINTPTLFESNATIGATWTVIMQTPITSISNVVAAGYSAYTNYDSATGAFIITANKTIVNEVFDAIRVTTTSLASNFDILYIASNNITADVYSVGQLIVNGNLLPINLNTNVTVVCNASKIRFPYNATFVANGSPDGGIATLAEGEGSKFGKCAFLFTVSYITIQDNRNGFDFGTGDFTVEGWYRFSNITADMLLFGGAIGTNSFDFRRYSDNGLRVGRTNNIWDATTVGGLFTVSSVWQHIAVSRNNGFMRIFVNGIQRWSGNNTVNYSMSSTIYMGKRPTELTYTGGIDEVRVSNIARYTGDFSVPTAPFVNDSNTIMLLHFNTATNNVTPDDIS